MSNNKIDGISKFYCTVNKPFYYIISVLIIVPIVCNSAFVSSNSASLLFASAILLYSIIMRLLYISCKKNKEKKGTLQLKQLSTVRKIWYILSTIGIILISTVFTSFLCLIPILIKN